jgi:hypothetical protein
MATYDARMRQMRRRERFDGGVPLLSMDRVWTIVALAIPVIAGLALSMSTVDLTYHLRLGEQVLHGALPRTDAFTFSAFGEPWTNQQWLAQAILAGVHRLGAWNAVVLLRAVLIGISFTLTFLACRAAGASVRAAAGLTVAAYLLSAQNLGMRPQLFAVPLFAATVWISTGRRGRPGRQWAIPALVAIWANVHGSFVLGLALVAFDWLEDRRDGSPGARRTLLVGIVAGAATLANPFGPRVWSYAVEIGTNPTITRFASEWEPTTIRSFTGAGLFVSAALVTWFLARRPQAPPWPTLLRLACFFAVALPAIRGVVWWGLVAPVTIAALLPRSDAPAGGGGDRRGSPVLNGVIVACVLTGVVLALPWWRTAENGDASAMLVQAPEGLADATERVSSPGDRVWVDQVWGSWFEYRLPDRPVFVDSRIELYPQRVWTDYLDAANGREGWQAILDRWEVDVVVLDPDQSGQLVERIGRDAGWQRAYLDDDGSVYVRAT